MHSFYVGSRFQNRLGAKLQIVTWMVLLLAPSLANAQGLWTHPDLRFVDVDTAVRNDDFPRAQKLISDLRTQARKGKDNAFQTEVTERGKEITKISREFEKLSKAFKGLEKDSEDARASLEVGKYFCVVKSNWQKGLPLLAAGNDERLGSIAKADQLNPKESDDQFRLADQWWQYAQKISDADERTAWLLRSRDWMLLAKDSVGTEELSTIKGRLKQIPIYPDRIVVWNTHNGTYNDRGAVEIVVSLLREGKVAWRQPILIPWKANEPSFIVIRPARVRADQLRVDIVKRQMTSGGLGEIQVFVGNANVARGMLAEVESVFEFKEQNGPPALVDGDVSGTTGFWICQNDKDGWAIVDFQQLPAPAKK